MSLDALDKIVSEIKEVSYGTNGVVTALRNGKKKIPQKELDYLTNLFHQVRIELQKNNHISFKNHSELVQLISTLYAFSRYVPWIDDFTNDLVSIISQEK